jgi:hypothetical protein
MKNYDYYFKLKYQIIDTKTGQFDRAIESCGCSIIILYDAFNAGSSKHGLFNLVIIF